MGTRADSTAFELAKLPAAIDVPTAARILGIGNSLAYDLIKAGQFPVQPLRLGRLIRIPTQELARVLGVTTGSEDDDPLPTNQQ